VQQPFHKTRRNLEDAAFLKKMSKFKKHFVRYFKKFPFQEKAGVFFHHRRENTSQLYIKRFFSLFLDSSAFD